MRCAGKSSEENLLLRSFKFFDLQNSGKCKPQEFLRSLVRVGVNNVNEDNLNDYFKLYDHENKGEIKYRDFIEEIFSPNTQQRQIIQNINTPSQKNTDSDFQNQKSRIEKALEENKRLISKIQESFKEEGVEKLFDLELAFRDLDKENNGNINIDEFFKICSEYPFNINKNEAKIFFNCFDPDREGHINYDDVLAIIHGQLNMKRTKLIESAFKFLDINNQGSIDLIDLLQRFSTKNHPDVINQKYSEDEIEKNFINCFKKHHKYFNDDDNRVSFDEFIDFYENISLGIDDDAYFENLIVNFWNLNSNTVTAGVRTKNDNDSNTNKKPNKLISPEQKESLDILNKIRDALKYKGSKAVINLIRAFKVIDNDNSNGVDIDEFTSIMKDYLNKQEISKIFNLYDDNNTGIIKYNDFLNDVFLKKEIPQKRINLIKEIFNNLDLENHGTIEFKELNNIYSYPKNNEPNPVPDLLDSFKLFHNLMRGSRQPLVKESEFVDFYSTISFLIEEIKEDKLFNSFVSNTWRLNDKSFEERKNLRKNPIDNLGKQKRYSNQKNVISNKAPYGVDDEKINYNKSGNATLKYNFDKFEDILAHFRKCFKLRGVRGIMSLRRALMLFDVNITKVINLKDFKNLLQKTFRFDFEDIEIQNMFNYFDKDRKGEINYEEFIKVLVGNVNENRKKILKQVFDKINEDNGEYITVGQMRNCYNAKESPLVRQNKKNEDEMMAEFMDLIEYHFNLLNERDEESLDINQIKIDFDDFIEFYKYISMVIDDDKYFEVMLMGEWGLKIDGKYPYQRGWSKKDF